MTYNSFKTSIIIIFLLSLLPIQRIYSQSIKGTVIDEDKNPLEFVSVALLQTKDSLMVSYTSTGPDGKFELSEFKSGTYMFQVYLGHINFLGIRQKVSPF